MEQPLFLCQQHSTAMRPPAAPPAAAVAAHTPVVQLLPVAPASARALL